MKKSKKPVAKGQSAIIKHAITSLIAIIMSSIVPMLQQWHTDRQQKEALTAVEVRCNEKLAEFKMLQFREDKALWEAIQKNHSMSR